MVEHAREFETNGYSFLPCFLDAETAKTFCEIVKEADGWSDAQVPGAKSLRDHPALDGMLEQVLPNVEFASGKTLYPTYAYARVYKKGDVLKPHKDRPACEISVTLCLGSDGTSWPIFMADGEFDEGGHTVKNVRNENAIELSPGDAVLYKGCEKVHWRGEFTGEWMAQVFLHYVDAYGPHAKERFDGRQFLAHRVPPLSSLPYFVEIEDGLNPDACMKVIEQTEKHNREQAGVGAGTGTVDKTIRDVERLCLPIHRGIGAAMAGIGLHANRENWHFDIHCANQCEFLRYSELGHYHAHVDCLFDLEQPCRKLTVLCFLNDDYEGGRFFIQIGNEKMYPEQKPGTVVVFPSFLLHGVEPVTKGVRRSLVTWLVGPWFK